MRSATIERIRKSILDRSNEAFSYADGINGIFGAYRTLQSCFVIGRFLEMIVGSKIACEAAIKSCVFLRKLMKLDFHPSMGLRNPICALEDKGLRGMKLRVIGKARRLPGNPDSKDGLLASSIASAALAR